MLMTKVFLMPGSPSLQTNRYRGLDCSQPANGLKYGEHQVGFFLEMGVLCSIVWKWQRKTHHIEKSKKPWSMSISSSILPRKAKSFAASLDKSWNGLNLNTGKLGSDVFLSMPDRLQYAFN